MKTLILAMIVGFLVSWNVKDYAEPEWTDPNEHAYVGADKCKPCHMSPKKGAQYKSWKESKHAQAFETLGSDKAKEIATAKGLGNPQTELACLKCHIDGAGLDAKFYTEKYRKEDGVSCESCHGAGGDYWTKEVMQAITDGKTPGESVGLIKPDEARCKTCHNEESPTYKPFTYSEMHSLISHPRPK